jgi:hypothetical protein
VKKALPLQASDGRVERRGADVIGALAVHRSLKGDYWAVSSVTTGLFILSVKAEGDARRIASYLHEVVGGHFLENSAKMIVRGLPGWVVPWCKECRRKNRWVSPDVFREE